jgi:hypothetical protein
MGVLRILHAGIGRYVQIKQIRTRLLIEHPNYFSQDMLTLPCLNLDNVINIRFEAFEV